MNDSVRLRPGQQEILKYRGGRMGISAVPGSGKTWTLSYLAAKLIQSGEIKPDQEILIVTLVNAAVDNFSSRISSQLQVANQLPGVGYRVRTLHGLANDIVHERPDLAGLSADFQIVDEKDALQIKEGIAKDWLNAHKSFFEPYIDCQDYQLQKVYEGDKNLPDLIIKSSAAFIRMAKDWELTPDALRQRLHHLPINLPLVQMGTEIYSEYQNALVYRGSVDFDDLIRLALRCLKTDPALVKLLRKRWPYILEDEAQDSSHLQQEILAMLAGDSGNWVRVGDPNQAIYETFTTASPHYLLDFLKQPDVDARALPESGRSTHSIINLANSLIKWTQEAHPNAFARSALTPPMIQPTPPDDPQPNPDDCSDCIQFVAQEMTPEQEIVFIVDAVETFLTDHPDKTIAILSPLNTRAFKFVDALNSRKIPCVDDLLQSTSATRLSTGAIANILNYLGDPNSSRNLAAAYRVWRRNDREDENTAPIIKKVSRIIEKCEQLEDYLWPSPGKDWLDEEAQLAFDTIIFNELLDFKALVQRWHTAIYLPIDQLILTIAQDLFLDSAELALAHKLSLLLRQLSNAHPDWRLPEFTVELANIAKNERRYLGFSQEDSFDPDRYPGQVVVATMHKAKGLEWDCVFLTSLNNYSYPSGYEYDQFQSEKWFIRGHLNLEAEIIAQLRTLIESHPFDWYEPGKASIAAREELISERLRLLYVGITRARRWLTATWNTGRPTSKNVAALPFLEMINDLERSK